MADFFAGESFAVVDLETTGTRKEEGDRIIQFGCAIVKDGEVVKTYSFMMNPHRKIPLAVTNLTGIDQKMVAGQADFNHYAPKIREILQAVSVCRFFLCLILLHQCRENQSAQYAYCPNGQPLTKMNCHDDYLLFLRNR